MYIVIALTLNMCAQEVFADSDSARVESYFGKNFKKLPELKPLADSGFSKQSIDSATSWYNKFTRPQVGGDSINSETMLAWSKRAGKEKLNLSPGSVIIGGLENGIVYPALTDGYQGYFDTVHVNGYEVIVRKESCNNPVADLQPFLLPTKDTAKKVTKTDQKKSNDDGTQNLKDSSGLKNTDGKTPGNNNSNPPAPYKEQYYTNGYSCHYYFIEEGEIPIFPAFYLGWEYHYDVFPASMCSYYGGYGYHPIFCSGGYAYFQRNCGLNNCTNNYCASHCNAGGCHNYDHVNHASNCNNGAGGSHAVDPNSGNSHSSTGSHANDPSSSTASNNGSANEPGNRKPKSNSGSNNNRNSSSRISNAPMNSNNYRQSLSSSRRDNFKNSNFSRSNYISRMNGSGYAGQARSTYLARSNQPHSSGGSFFKTGGRK